jgi:hypothetical protein
MAEKWRQKDEGHAAKIFVQAAASPWKSTKDFFGVVLGHLTRWVVRGFYEFKFRSTLFKFGGSPLPPKSARSADSGRGKGFAGGEQLTPDGVLELPRAGPGGGCGEVVWHHA